MRKTISCMAALLIMASGANAVTISYSKATANRTNAFQMGTSLKQGQAIRLPKAKLQMLKGKTIDFAEFILGTKNTEGNKIHAFISTSLDGAPITEGDVQIENSLVKTKWTLDKPYTITGDEEELYVGYTANVEFYKLLMSDGSFDIKGYNFALKDDEWTDTYGTGRGSAYISVNVDGGEDYADIIMGKYDFSGYYKAGNDNKFPVDIVNAGTLPVNSFDAEVIINNEKTVQHFTGLNIAPKEGYSFNLDKVSTNDEGEKEVQMAITNVNGGDNDIDPTDNTLEASVFFYPANMERSILVEGFTGQSCTACAAGHETITQAIDFCEEALKEKIVEVSHHSGYYVDAFTMKDDDDLRFFYSDPEHTYAPAVMANRVTGGKLNPTSPVISTGYGDIVQLISNASEIRPMASLNLETSLNKETRELKVKLQVKPHAEMPQNAVFNVWLIQDGIKAYQNNGGANYKHSRVSRGTLTNASFGLPLTGLKPGEVTTWETTYVIPEKIHSSIFTDDMIQDITDSRGNTKQYYVYSFPSGATIKVKVDEADIATDIDNMSVIAYVGECDKDDKTRNVVFNSTEAKVGESHKQTAFENTAGIETVRTAAPACKIYVNNGKICVDGSYDKLQVYNLSGVTLNGNARLQKGTYVVRVVSDGVPMTKKLLVE